jgi:uncharacterized protein (DUF4415 family)
MYNDAKAMKKAYDFCKGKRGAVIPTTGKTRITIYVDDAIIKSFRAESKKRGKGYQTLINDALKIAVSPDAASIASLRSQPGSPRRKPPR